MVERAKVRAIGLIGLVRVMAGLVVAAGCLWFTTVVTLAGALRNAQPEVVLKWAGWDAGAHGERGSRQVMSARSAGDVLPARSAALTALRRDPTSLTAVRTLAFVADAEGNGQRAQQLFSYAAWLSRRDLATHIWFIEREVDEADVAGALRHFDRALRASSSASQVLFPVLLSASGETEVAHELAKLLASRPLWWRAFANQMVYKGESLDSAVTVTRGLYDPEQEDDREILRVLLDRLVRAKRFELVHRLYGDLELGASQEGYLRNGSFENDNLWPPFDWKFVDEPGFAAAVQPRPSGQGSALYLLADNGRGGELASQLLRLPNGRYKASGVIGDTGPEPLVRPILMIRCASSPAKPVLSFVLPGSNSEGRRFSQEFIIPARCENQFLSLTARSNPSGQKEEPAWIDDLVISRS